MSSRNRQIRRLMADIFDRLPMSREASAEDPEKRRQTAIRLIRLVSPDFIPGSPSLHVERNRVLPCTPESLIKAIMPEMRPDFNS